MRLILLGTTGYHPNDRRQTPCLLLPECGVMLDAGTALYRATEYLATPELDIFITHSHLDHIIGLTYLFSVLHAHPLKRVTLHGLPESLRAVEEHLFAEALFPARPPFECRPLTELPHKGTVPFSSDENRDSPLDENRDSPLDENRDSPLTGVALCDGGRLTHFPLEHRGATIGYRLDWPGHSMAYVTDTTADEQAAYVEKIRGVDLLVHECYLSDSQADWAKKVGHSHTTPVAQVARRAGVKRLVLVHLNPNSTSDDPVGLDVARAIFPNTILGEDRMELEF